MVHAYRVGKEFTFQEREAKREAVGHRCEGCNREIYTRRDNAHPDAETLEIHHADPIENGGGRDSQQVALCGKHGCHDVVDRLTKFRGIFWDEIVERNGSHPFEQYAEVLDRRTAADVKKVADHVAHKMRRGQRIH